jgi:hypothetical protein
MARARLRFGRPVLWRSTVHHLFLHELQDYRRALAPVARLVRHAAPEVRLLGESFRESAQMALERAIKALACWYDPKPLLVAYERLDAEAPETRTPALEYLGHVLPRRLSRAVSETFELTGPPEAELADLETRVAEWIRIAWTSDDPWLRACAVRASRAVPVLDPEEWSADGAEPAIVRAEIEAYREAWHGSVSMRAAAAGGRPGR